MAADPDRFLVEVRNRYPNLLGALRDMAGKRGVPPLPEWPEWCWLPMAAAASAATHPEDIARLAAVSTWWLDRAVIEVDEDLASRHIPAPDRDIRIDRERLLTGLPSWCPYVLVPEPPTAAPAGFWPCGFFVHTEWDAARGGAPELRILADIDGTWDGLVAVPVHADQPTVRWSAQDAARLMATNAAAKLVPDAQGDLLTGAVELGELLARLVWPLVAALVDPAGRAIGRDRPGEVLERVQPERRGDVVVWPRRPRTSSWRMTAGPAPRPGLRSV
ncbi:hypothetical protein [Parafrankia sp. EUN1f]|uniref:hypothetical protein n=1 Tax=Parafrankia sp. EUN1f TaxID=102897 RepID=UPI0001C46455|nr:hypothetical protein [Parafrankia sp. EUN1f]EFC80885.1 hypothetical protein FrEUN1fDRAFT_5987 [Parafrankia sp. EUN1f]